MGFFKKKKTQPGFDPYSSSARDRSAFSNALLPATYDAHGTAIATAVAMSEPPKKYIKVNGVMKLSPHFKRWKDAQSGNASTNSPPAAQALPIVSNMDDYTKLNTDLKQDIPLAESTNATIEMMQEPEISVEAGMTPDSMVNSLGGILAKHECPMGLMNKLLMLSEYESLDFIIDDSGSMQMTSDTINPQTRMPQTRWEEAHGRLKEMVEILAYLPFTQIKIEFLNRPNTVVLTRQGRDPQTFLADAYRQIDQVFGQGPSGTTPALEKLQESILIGQGKSIARYFFGDGRPNGGDYAQKQIVQVLMHRENPAGNPITFLSCTNEDAQVECALSFSRFRETRLERPNASESPEEKRLQSDFSSVGGDDGGQKSSSSSSSSNDLDNSGGDDSTPSRDSNQGRNGNEEEAPSSHDRGSDGNNNAGSGGADDGESVEEPSPTYIVLGELKKTRERGYPGNIWFERLVLSKREKLRSYSETNSRGNKGSFLTELITEAESSGYRFVKKRKNMDVFSAVVNEEEKRKGVTAIVRDIAEELRRRPTPCRSASNYVLLTHRGGLICRGTALGPAPRKLLEDIACLTEEMTQKIQGVLSSFHGDGGHFLLQCNNQYFVCDDISAAQNTIFQEMHQQQTFSFLLSQMLSGQNQPMRNHVSPGPPSQNHQDDEAGSNLERRLIFDYKPLDDESHDARAVREESHKKKRSRSIVEDASESECLKNSWTDSVSYPSTSHRQSSENADSWERFAEGFSFDDEIEDEDSARHGHSIMGSKDA